jgi:hypothetical protein
MTTVHATTSLPPALVMTYTYITATSTTSQTHTTVIPNCFPRNGYILPNSSWPNVAWNLPQDDPLWYQYYCGGIGGCLNWQVRKRPVCNILALEDWRAWDPSLAPTGVTPGVGGPMAVATTLLQPELGRPVVISGLMKGGVLTLMGIRSYEPGNE